MHATDENVSLWLEGGYDEESKARVRAMSEEERADAFYTHLSFGTGGLRGIMGDGTNRMNVYTVRAATQGLANYLNKQEGSPSVFIGYDSRHHSREFAEETTKVLAANGIRVFLTEGVRPVPLVSFGVRHLQCMAGVMITASHNPPAYNGYKVYWSDGSQVLPPHDVGIIAEVGKIKTLEQVKRGSLRHEKVHEVGEEVDRAYLEAVRPLQLHDGENGSHGRNLKVVYTPLHGAGIALVPPTLADWGFTNVTLVEEQVALDGAFPTVKTPNPEDPAALALGKEKLEAVGGDLLLGTDPDTDRIAAVIRHGGELVHFTGNQMAALCLEHICRSLHETKEMPPKPACVKTIVTTELVRAIADHYKVTCFDVLTGFKYIGQLITGWEHEGEHRHRFLFGGEESYGYLVGTHARDKDAVVSAALICEMTLHQKLQGKTLLDLLYEIYETYGVYREKLITHTLEGKEGAEKIAAIMDGVRAHPPKTLGEATVEVIEDYLARMVTHPQTGHQEPLLLPSSNAFRLFLSDHTKIVIRPSGTEPKIKLYISVFEKHHPGQVERTIESCDLRLEEYAGHLTAWLS